MLVVAVTRVAGDARGPAGGAASPPPPQEAPLSVQLEGIPLKLPGLPLKPKLTVAPGARVALAVLAKV